MPTDRQIRLGLWLSLLASADANRRYYGLPTTWVPHTVGNTIGLALPEVVAALDRLLATLAPDSATLQGLRATAREVTTAPPGWAVTMAPVTLAYVVSHPQFNIYKGELGELRLLGFGLDALPHSATAFSLTHLVYQSIAALAKHMPSQAALAPLARRLNRHPVLVAGLVLAGLTAFYEVGEYRIHQAELEATGGDVRRINMVWDVNDTAHDIVSNLVGWLLATWVQQQAPELVPSPESSALSPQSSTLSA